MSTKTQEPTIVSTAPAIEVESTDHWLATFEQNIDVLERWLAKMDDILAQQFPDAKVLRLSSRDITMVLSEATAQLRQSQNQASNKRYLDLIPKIEDYIKRSDAAMKQSDARLAAAVDGNDLDLQINLDSEAQVNPHVTLMDSTIARLTAITNAYNEKFKENPDLLKIFIEQQKMLLSLTIELITSRHTLASAQPPAPPPNGPVDNSGGGGDDAPMEARISALEKDMSAVKTDVAVIRSNYATKEDLHKELHAATWKIIGAIAVLTTAVFYLARTPIGATPTSSPPSNHAQLPPSLPEQAKPVDQIPK